MSHRAAQVESALRRAISEVLGRRISDPRIVGLVSVTRVKVSPDLHDAYVYVSVLPVEHQALTVQGLRHATRYIHSLVRDEVAMKSVPHLDFRADDSLKKQAEVFDAIRRAHERDQQASQGAKAVGGFGESGESGGSGGNDPSEASGAHEPAGGQDPSSKDPTT
ncbi:MAG: 30S ribosome-binding factor RbfA [Phycisphaeraceae bacterium]